MVDEALLNAIGRIQRASIPSGGLERATRYADQPSGFDFEIDIPKQLEFENATSYYALNGYLQIIKSANPKKISPSLSAIVASEHSNRLNFRVVRLKGGDDFGLLMNVNLQLLLHYFELAISIIIDRIASAGPDFFHLEDLRPEDSVLEITNRELDFIGALVRLIILQDHDQFPGLLGQVLHEFDGDGDSARKFVIAEPTNIWMVGHELAHIELDHFSPNKSTRSAAIFPIEWQQALQNMRPLEQLELMEEGSADELGAELWFRATTAKKLYGLNFVQGFRAVFCWMKFLSVTERLMVLLNEGPEAEEKYLASLVALRKASEELSSSPTHFSFHGVTASISGPIEDFSPHFNPARVEWRMPSLISGALAFASSAERMKAMSDLARLNSLFDRIWADLRGSIFHDHQNGVRGRMTL